MDESDAEAAEVLDGDQPVAERVGHVLDPLPPRTGGVARHQFDAATAVEARAYLVFLHLAPLTERLGSP
ncbi:hypothetical protein ACIQM3_07870 [Streptomyces sp. NPDC091271]|uniref:hypothetical protein n=1 Tax=Streptomyces sp. NPDC091271 TaxID=3365980 RepID=UPI00381122B2